MHTRLLLLAVVAITLTLFDRSRETSAQSPWAVSQKGTNAFQPAPCPFLPGVDQVEGQTVICGVVTIPEDRIRPAGPTIHLAVAIFKARNETGAPPLMFLGGGPGSAVLGGFGPAITGALADDLTTDRDLILFDQRGVGLSRPSLACQELTDLENQRLGMQINSEEASAGTLQAALSCRDRLRSAGINLAAYTTAAGAADVDDIRRALGYASVDLWGPSYGTRLALTVIDTYPATVHAAVLDSVLPPQVRQLVAIPSSAERAFRVLFDGCAADSDCAAAYPGLEATFYQLVAELNNTPISFQAQHPRTGAVYPVILTGDGLVRNLFNALYHTDLIPALPLVGAALRRGDISLLALAAGRLLFTNDNLSHGMNFSVQCAEEGNLTDPSQVALARAQVRPEIGNVFTQENLFRICAEWGAARVSPGIKSPVISAIPTLILSGEYDPITPPDFAALAGRTLRNSFAYTFPGIGHNVHAASPCPHAIMLQFLNNPTREPDTGCIAQMGPPSWLILPAE